MATFPEFPSEYGADVPPVAKPIIDRADDGTGHMILTHDKVTVTLTFPRMTQSQCDTLMSFYEANKGSAVDCVMKHEPGEPTRQMFMVGKPTVRRVAGNLWDVVVTLEEA